jgi:hypothetical protein
MSKPIEANGNNNFDLIQECPLCEVSDLISNLISSEYYFAYNKKNEKVYLNFIFHKKCFNEMQLSYTKYKNQEN